MWITVQTTLVHLRSLQLSRYLSAVRHQTARWGEMAKDNKAEEEFDTVYSRNDSLELSAQHDHDTTQARTFKIIVIGDSNVGKTCLTYRFCGGTFLKNPEATIGVDFRERSVELDGESVKVRGNTQQHKHTPPHTSHISFSCWSNLSEPWSICGRGGESVLELYGDSIKTRGNTQTHTVTHNTHFILLLNEHNHLWAVVHT